MQNQENIHTYDNGFHPKEVKLKDNYKFYRKGIVIRSITRLLVWLVKLIIIIPNFFVWGFKVKGKKNLKKSMENEKLLKSCSNKAGLIEMIPIIAILVIYLVVPFALMVVEMYQNLNI